MKVMIFDCETGGLDSHTHSLLSLGMVVGDLDTGEIIDTYEAYHKMPSIEDYCVTPEAEAIHGISVDTAFNEGVSTEELQEAFADMWAKHNCLHWGGHNANPFDVNFMSRQVFKFEPEQFVANFGHRSLDSLPVVRMTSGIEPVKSGGTLTSVAKFLKIDMSDYGKNKFHAALFDSIVAFRVLHRYRKVFSSPVVIDLLKNE